MRKTNPRNNKQAVDGWMNKCVFVAIPPDVVEPDAGYPRFTDLRETQERYMESLWIRANLDIFKERQDPIALMQAFVASMNMSIYPPVLILQALAVAFQTVLESAGKKPLDQVLGLRRKGRGAWNAFTAKNRKGTQLWLAINIHTLVKKQGLSLERAAERVSLLCESLPGTKLYAAEGLVDQYSRKWKKQFQRELAIALTFEPVH